MSANSIERNWLLICFHFLNYDPQGLHEGGGPMGLPEYGAAPQRRVAGYGG